MTTNMCKEILFEVTGNAVDIARAHEIDLRDTFGSIDALEFRRSKLTSVNKIDPILTTFQCCQVIDFLGYQNQ